MEEMARPVLFVAIVAGVFVGGVAAVKPGRRHVRNAVILAVFQMVLAGIAVALPDDSAANRVVAGLGLASIAALIVYSIVCVIGFVLRATHITRDQIYAGISAYLMLGFAFGCVYYLVNIVNPGGFAVNSPKLGAAPDLIYFSFVTLTTLGYGDITPVGKAARALVELEAVSGMIYIAVFMARLVSLHSGESDSSSVSAPDKPQDLAVRPPGGPDST
jgi:hypothetical protein